MGKKKRIKKTPPIFHKTISTKKIIIIIMEDKNMKTKKYENITMEELEEKRIKSRGQEKVILNLILTE